METSKTTVQVTQELLALATARHERLQADRGQGGRPGEAPEEDRLVQMLMEELSMYGDGVSGSIDKTDPYFNADTHNEELFEKAVNRLREEAGEMPDTLVKIFNAIDGR